MHSLSVVRATLLVCFVIIALAAPRAYAQLSATACPTGSVPIVTTADRAAAHIAGIPDSSNCWQKQDPNVGADAAQAKLYLRSIVCKGSAFGGTTADGTVEGLDTKFAQCAAKFLKAMSASLPGQLPLLNGGTNAVCLREGFRTVAQQEKYAAEYRNGGGIACTRGAQCEHPRGIAIDVNTATEQGYQTMWAQGPSFGVNFYLKARDKVHFVPMQTGCTGGGTTPVAGTGSTGTGFPTGGTNSNSLIPASFFDYPQYAQPASAASSIMPFISPLTTLAQAAFGQTSQTPQTTTPTQPYNPYVNPTSYVPPAPDTTTNTSSYSPSNPFIYNVPASSSSMSTQGQTDAESVAAYAHSDTVSGSTGSNAQTGTTSGTPGTGTGSSAATGGSAATELNSNLTEISTSTRVDGTGIYNPTTNNISNIMTGTIAMNTTLASTSVAIPPVYVQETFGHQQQPSQLSATTSDSPARSMLISLLTALRDFLLTYLSFLKNRDTTGFQGSWQMPGSVPQYR